MHVAQIWRYPVKSMAGERVREAALGPAGVPGDRMVFATDAAGRLVTARRYPRLLRHRGSLGENGDALVDGRSWDSPEVARWLEEDVAPGARFERSNGSGRFDMLPMLVATDGSAAAFGYDVRRLRPNLLIEGVEGLAERRWEGARLKIGEAVIYLDSLRGRCVMTTIDLDTNEQDEGVLESIIERFDGRLCLNAAIEHPGVIREQDQVRLVQP